MEGSKYESISVMFNGKNFALWEFQFRIFVDGKGYTTILDGSLRNEGTDEVQQQWRTKNAQVMTWKLNSIEPDIALSLRAFKTAATMWTHLSDIYSQVDRSRKFHLEFEIANISQEGRDIRTFYVDILKLWTEQDMITCSTISDVAYTEVQKEKDHIRVLQFIMKLCPEFESIRASLINRGDLAMESVLRDLIREETRLHTQIQLDSKSNSVDTIFLTYRGKFQSQSKTDARCRFCNEVGHVQSHCIKCNFCNYCKKPGHIILDCRVLKNKQRNSAFVTMGSVAETPIVAFANNVVPQASMLSPDAIQKMIHESVQSTLPGAISSAFSIVVLSGPSHRKTDHEGAYGRTFVSS